jgi:hypothetical protein
VGKVGQGFADYIEVQVVNEEEEEEEPPEYTLPIFRGGGRC